MTAEAFEDEDGTVDGEDLPRKRWSGKRIVLFVVLPVFLLGAIGAGIYFSGILDRPAGEEPAAPSVFYDLPDLVVNLESSSRRPGFLKISVSLELTSQADLAAIQSIMPRVIDNFQVYLRELRIDDLRGSAGMYRLREELLLRVNAAVAPVRVKDVLFREMLVQ